MSDLTDLLGIDESDPEQQLASHLVEQDAQLLDMLVERRRALMSQQELAAKLGISQPAVQQFERRDGDPRLSTIRRYALALGLLVTHRVEAFDDHRSDGDGRAQTFDFGQDGLNRNLMIRQSVGRKARELRHG